MKALEILTALVWVVMTAGCSDLMEEDLPDGERLCTKTFVISQTQRDNGTKSTLDGTTVNWQEGDAVHYYTGQGTTGAKTGDIKHATISEAGTAAQSITLEYSLSDKNVVFFTKGSAVGSAATSDMDYLEFDDGVPASQNGEFAETHIGAGLADLRSQSATLKTAQSYLKFKLSSNLISDNEINKITIEGRKSGDLLTGDVRIKLSDGSVTYPATGRTNLITIDKKYSAFEAGKVYYVAVAHGTYGDGLTVRLKHDDKELGIIQTKSLSVSTGDIFDLGELKDNVKRNLFSVKTYPEYAAFTKDIVKSIWLNIEPSDFDGEIEWTIDNTAIKITPKKDGSGKNLKEDIDTEEGKKSCYVCTVTLVNVAETAYTTTVSGNVNVTVKPKYGSNVTKTVPVEIGKWVTLGDITKDETTKKAVYVLWGMGPVTGVYTSASMRCEKNPFAGYVYGHDYRDVGKQLGTGCSTPTSTQWNALRATTNLKGVKDDDGIYRSRYTSKEPGFTDCYIKICASNLGGGSDGAGRQNSPTSGQGVRWTYHCLDDPEEAGFSNFMRSQIVSSSVSAEQAFGMAIVEIYSIFGHSVWPIRTVTKSY